MENKDYFYLGAVDPERFNIETRVIFSSNMQNKITILFNIIKF